MAISRSLMNRQLQANGGIMQVAPREKFGLGSKLKSFARKIIPNEVAEVAVKAAPFVAPFNPALAGAMAGIGSFDQTGSIGDAFKRGALTYGGGQAARYIGGAGFQGNPFEGGLQGTLQNFSTFSSPIGTETGLGKFISNRGTQPVLGVGESNIDATGKKLAETAIETRDLVKAGEVVPGIDPGTYVSPLEYKAFSPPNELTVTQSIKKIVSPETTFQEKGGEALKLLKKTGKAAFYKKNAQGEDVLDKAAILGAITFAGSYAEAKALAAQTGVDEDLTEEEYDELTREEKRAEYADLLTNFFGGKKDGGRIGFKDGYSPGIVKKALKEYNSVYGIDASGEEILVKDLYSGGFDEFLEIFARDNRAQGGRIGFKKGSPDEPSEIGIMSIDVEAGDDEDEEDMDDLMAGITFSSAEKSYLFRRLGAAGGASRTYSMPNLYRILNNPGAYPNDAAILKQIAIMGLGKKDGGRIGLKDGTDEKLKEILEMDMTISKNPNDPRNMTTNEIIFAIQDGRSTPEMFEELLLRDTGGVSTLMLDEIGGKKFDEPKKVYQFNPSESSQGGAIEDLLFKLRESNPDIYGEYFRPSLEKDRGYRDAPLMAKGGRIGYAGGANRVSELLILRDQLLGKGEDVSDIEAELFQLTGKTFRSIGGIGDVPTGNLRKNSAGIIERDYRDEGGFVPVGVKERADDVPAMLSKNEFVMTADAVRGIGGGDVEKGSKRLYNTMKKAEQVGKA
tara:strand:+ start:11706 stop:13907 length:2202 start_codon:yes stop_codon:yes gene_type:complete